MVFLCKKKKMVRFILSLKAEYKVLESIGILIKSISKLLKKNMRKCLNKVC